jgi:hypothetical protein
MGIKICCKVFLSDVTLLIPQLSPHMLGNNAFLELNAGIIKCVIMGRQLQIRAVATHKSGCSLSKIIVLLLLNIISMIVTLIIIIVFIIIAIRIIIITNNNNNNIYNNSYKNNKIILIIIII